MGMAYDMVMGNCFLYNLNSHFDCEGLITILGINTLVLILLPLNTSTSMTKFANCVTISHVPL